MAKSPPTAVTQRKLKANKSAKAVITTPMESPPDQHKRRSRPWGQEDVMFAYVDDETVKEVPNIFKIIVLSSEPRDEARISSQVERRTLNHALQAAEHRDRFEVVDAPACRISDIGAALNHKPDIIHVIAHRDRGEQLCLEDNDGNAQDVALERFGPVFKLAAEKDRLKAVLLNSCHSEVKAEVLSKSVGILIAMKDTVTSTAAIAFTREFYTRLGGHKELMKKAFIEAFQYAEALSALEFDETKLKPCLFVDGARFL